MRQAFVPANFSLSHPSALARIDLQNRHETRSRRLMWR